MKIIEMPNKPIMVAFVGFIFDKLFIGTIHKLGATVFTIAIIVWAYEEIFNGDNWIRRTLGVVVLGAVAYSLFTQLR